MPKNVVGARELKVRLGTYLRRVRQGHRLVVTDRGQPVAELRPIGREAGAEAVLAELEARGVVTRPTRKRLTPFRLIESPDRPLSAAVPGGPRRPVLMRYFDASALAKRYVREKGSLKVRRLLSSDLAATSRYSAVEIASALARRVRERVLTDGDRDRALTALQEDMTVMLAVELTPEVVIRAQTLLRRHSLRAGDAVQLASCLHLQEALDDRIALVAFDERLLAAARKEHLAVV